MKKREKGLLILCVVAIFCVICIAILRQSGIADIQYKSSISDAQNQNSISDAQNQNSISDAQDQSSISDAQDQSNISDTQDQSSISDTQDQSNIPVTDRQDQSSISDTQDQSNIPVTDRKEDNWQNHLGELDEDTLKMVPPDDGYDMAISSEDNNYTVFVRNEERQKLHIYNSEKNKLDQIDVTPDLATDIMTLEWIDQDKVAVWSHVNPSLGCLDIYDVNNLRKLTEKYCSAYAWAQELDTLIYVEPAPHLSSSLGKEKILNIDDKILYQTDENEIIVSIANNDNGDIAIVAEKKDANYETESTNLVILEKKEGKYKVKEKTTLKRGEGNEIYWVNDTKISYSTKREGVTKVMRLAK